MKMDCDFHSIKTTLDSNPILSHCYQKKVIPYIRDLEVQLAKHKIIRCPKLNIREFADTFQAICIAYELDISQQQTYHSIMKQMNMALYFSEKNKALWANNIGIQPSIYDMALSIISTNKLNSIVEDIQHAIQYPPPFTSYHSVENIRDLEDYVELIQLVKKDTTSMHSLRAPEPVAHPTHVSEFGNY